MSTFYNGGNFELITRDGRELQLQFSAGIPCDVLRHDCTSGRIALPWKSLVLCPAVPLRFPSLQQGSRRTSDSPNPHLFPFATFSKEKRETLLY